MNWNALLFATAGLIIVLISQSSHADCVCRCVNGQSQALCSNKHLVQPTCRNICPLALPDLALRAPNCRMEPVLNSKTGRDRWREICK